MRLDESMSRLRIALLVAMGVSPTACGGEVANPHGSGGAGAEGGAGTTATNGTSTAATGGGAPCKDSAPIAVHGIDTGFAKCADGTVHKPHNATCDTTVRAPACQGT